MLHARGPMVNVPQDRACHILELIGNTPLLRLNHLGRAFPRVEIYANWRARHVLYHRNRHVRHKPNHRLHSNVREHIPIRNDHR